MPSQSVEAATRDEAIAAAREEYGPSVKIVGVRRIRSGGVLGFFAAERYVAEVDLVAPRTGAEPAARRADDAPRAEAPRRAPRARATEDERMSELADLLGPASGQLPLGLYSAAGVAQTPDIEDVVAQRRPRTAVSPDAGAPLRAGAATLAEAAGRPATRTARTAAPRTAAATPRTGGSGWDAAPPARATASPASASRAATSRATATPASRSTAPARSGRFAAAVQAAAAAPTAAPFSPARYRPTLDHLVDPAPEPPAAPAPAGPSAFTAALARMAADREVSAAVTDAVERSGTEDTPVEPAADQVFRVRAEEWVEEGEAVGSVDPAPAVVPAAAAPPAAVPAAAAPPAPAPPAPPAAVPTPAAPLAAAAPPAPAAAAAPVAAPVPVAATPVPAPAAVPTPAAVPAPAAVATDGAPAADVPPARDKRAALQSALQSVLQSAGSTDQDMEQLLEGVLERVLAGDPVATPAAVPPPAPADPAPQVDVASLTLEYLGADVDGLAARGRHRLPEPAAVGHPVTVEMAVVRPDDRADDSDEELADARAAADWTADWADEVRARQTRVHELRRDVVLDVRGNEVLAHREPLVMTPSMAAWPSLARTASDPAPLSMDHTTILPPLSLLPPQRMASVGGMPPLLRGRPAVPPARRSLPAGPSTISHPGIARRPEVPATTPRDGDDHAALEVTGTTREVARTAPAVPEVGPRLASVTRLVPAPSTVMTPYGLDSGDELVVRLLTLGLPEFLIAPGFAADAAHRGLYAALTRSLTERLAPVPEVPTEPGSVLLVVGPGPETLAAARALAVSVRSDPARVQWATPGDSATLVPEHSRITTLETATDRHRTSAGAGTVTIVAVDAPLRTGGGTWLTHMLSIWAPDAVWGVVDATRKLEDVVPWLDALPRLDAVVVQETEATADPAAVLSHLTAPVARIDGARATAHRWASLLCERLEEMDS